MLLMHKSVRCKGLKITHLDMSGNEDDILLPSSAFCSAADILPVFHQGRDCSSVCLSTLLGIRNMWRIMDLTANLPERQNSPAVM